MKLCVLLAAFGAVNWTVLAIADTDAVRALLGDERTVGTDGIRFFVSFASIAAIILIFRSDRR